MRCINLKFYECMGSKGWETLQKTLNYIPKNIFTIADAKRGDISNTSAMYAKTFFENMSFDSITMSHIWARFSFTIFKL